MGTLRNDVMKVADETGLSKLHFKTDDGIHRVVSLGYPEIERFYRAAWEAGVKAMRRKAEAMCTVVATDGKYGHMHADGAGECGAVIGCLDESKIFDEQYLHPSNTSGLFDIEHPMQHAAPDSPEADFIRGMHDKYLSELQALQLSAPEGFDPLNTPLPCEIKTKNCTFGKGVKLRVMVARMNMLAETVENLMRKKSDASTSELKNLVEKVDASWNEHGNSGMRYPEQSDLTGGETDCCDVNAKDSALMAAKACLERYAPMVEAGLICPPNGTMRETLKMIDAALQEKKVSR